MALRFYITADEVGSPSGGGQVTARELDFLEALGDDVITISHEELYPLASKLPDTPFLWDLLAADAVATVLRREKVVHAHFYSGTFTQTIRLLKAQGVFVTYTCPAHDRKVSAEEFARWGIAYPYPHLADDNLWRVFSGGLREADLVFAPSGVSAAFLRSEGCQEVHVVPHGHSFLEKVPPQPQKFAVGYLGQIGPDKGLIYLIQAWGLLNFITSPLLLAGRGTEGLEPLITRLVNRGRFRLMGYVQSPSELYVACSIYVQPSVSEAWGIEVGEAMAHGRPVIVSSGAGAADLVTDGVDGFIVPPRDPSAIAEKIRWFSDRPWEIITMGQAARKKAEENTWSRSREKYLELWGSPSPALRS